MIVKLLTDHHLEFLSLKGGCRGSSESTLVKMSNCWKSHALAHLSISGDRQVFSRTPKPTYLSNHPRHAECFTPGLPRMTLDSEIPLYAGGPMVTRLRLGPRWSIEKLDRAAGTIHMISTIKNGHVDGACQ